jgi:hypothetical protein
MNWFNNVKSVWKACWDIPKDIWSRLDNKEKSYLKAGFGLITIFSIISIIVIPLLLTQRAVSLFDFTKTGEIGDTIGGITAPFIGIIGAILTFLAFYVQYKANEQQRTQFEDELEKRDLEKIEQDKTWQIERFENKFYQLLSLHRDNVNEMQIGTGEYIAFKRKVFVLMFNELKFTFYCCKAFYNIMRRQNQLKVEYTDEQLLRLSYIFFYCGVGDNSDILSKAINKTPGLEYQDKFFDQTINYLKSMKEDKRKRKTYKDNDGNDVKYTNAYRPWGGHQSRLGHYSRHLFQTVKFVVSDANDFLTDLQKLDYLRSLRAQLSDHEQLLLYYNAVSNFGHDWIDNGYFTRYRMIHNIPIPLANFGVRPEDKFKNEISEITDLFEWLE